MPRAALRVRWAPMMTIARCGGYELVEVGPRLHFVDRDIGAHTIALFVLGLLAFITSVNGVLQLALSFDGGGIALLGAVLLVVGVGFGWVTHLVARARRARLALPASGLRLIVALDRERGTIEDGHGRVFGPLAGARFRRAFQIGSSSRALELAYVGGSIVVGRGSPFHGGVDELEDALRARGFVVG